MYVRAAYLEHGTRTHLVANARVWPDERKAAAHHARRYGHRYARVSVGAAAAAMGEADSSHDVLFLSTTMHLEQMMVLIGWSNC